MEVRVTKWSQPECPGSAIFSGIIGLTVDSGSCGPWRLPCWVIYGPERTVLPLRKFRDGVETVVLVQQGWHCAVVVT